MHVTWLGLQSRADRVILQRALQEDWVIVTNNRTDFIRLMEPEEVHAGLICLSAVPRFMNKELQKLLFEHALELLRGRTLSTESWRLGLMRTLRSDLGGMRMVMITAMMAVARSSRATSG